MRHVPNVCLSIKLPPDEQTRLRQWGCALGTPQEVALRPDYSGSVGK